MNPRGPIVYVVEPECPWCHRRYTGLHLLALHLNEERCPHFPPLQPGDCQTCAGKDPREPGAKYVTCVRCRPVEVVLGVGHADDRTESEGDIILAELLREAGPCDGKHGPMGCRRELVKESYRLGRERALPDIKEALRP